MKDLVSCLSSYIFLKFFHIIKKMEKTKFINTTNYKDFLNPNSIYPAAQRRVEKLIDSIRDNPNVLKVYIFGSSLTRRWTIYSDLDFYLVLKEDQKKILQKPLTFEYDMITNFNVDTDFLEKRILNKGELVYERK